jgi:hypothetical protein
MFHSNADKLLPTTQCHIPESIDTLFAISDTSHPKERIYIVVLGNRKREDVTLEREKIT